MRSLEFLPTQRKFLESVKDSICYSGGYGSGKTAVLCAKAVMLSLRYPKNRILLSRKYLQSFKATTYKTLMMGDGDMSPILPREFIKSENKTDRVITLINESEILYNGIEEEQIKSLNVSSIGVDEAGELTAQEILALHGRLRLSGVPVRQLFLVTNPYSDTHHLYNNFYLNPTKDDNGEPTAEMFFAPTTENKFLPQSYVDNLKRTLFGHYYERYILSRWVGADSLVFSEFDYRKHIISSFDIPKHWKRYRAVDFGFRSPYCCLWLTVVPEDDSDRSLKCGDIILYRELYFTERTSSVNASRVKELSVYSDGEPEKIEWTVCDWDAGDRADLDAQGIKTVQADKKDKLNRLQRIRFRLGNSDPSRGEIIRPTFYIFDSSLAEYDPKIRINISTGERNNNPTKCAEEFMAYSWKSKRDGKIRDEAEDSNDHSLDPLGYFMVMYEKRGMWKDIEFKSL